MTIRTVRILGFKRFDGVEFRLPGHVVPAGPQNTGKTTVLQAITSWSLSLQRWREFNDFNRCNGYTRAPIARQAFTAVPLRSFDLLWTDLWYQKNRPSRGLREGQGRRHDSAGGGMKRFLAVKNTHMRGSVPVGASFQPATGRRPAVVHAGRKSDSQGSPFVTPGPFERRDGQPAHACFGASSHCRAMPV